MKNSLPYFVRGKVVKGFGRGSKTLGTPTANFEQPVVDLLPSDLLKGIYFGWAQVNQSQVYPMVASIGWNPYFRNQIKSMETHIMNNFDDDFYGSTLKVCLVGYIRDELNFTTIDDLKDKIRDDINVAKCELAKEEFSRLSQNNFFNNPCNTIE